MHSVRQIGLTGAATVTAEREQLIGRLSRRENCDTHTLSNDRHARLYSLQKTLHTSALSSKSATARFAT